jgi:ABC-type branched-subunit amino acid transport system ATPase component
VVHIQGADHPKVALNLSDRAYIIEKGQIKWDGEVKILRERKEILKKYLGI